MREFTFTSRIFFYPIYRQLTSHHVLTWFTKDSTHISWSVSKKRDKSSRLTFSAISIGAQDTYNPVYNHSLRTIKGRHFEDVLKNLYRIIYKLALIALCLLELSTNWTPSLVLVSTTFLLVPVLREKRKKTQTYCANCISFFNVTHQTRISSSRGCALKLLEAAEARILRPLIHAQSFSRFFVSLLIWVFVNITDDRKPSSILLAYHSQKRAVEKFYPLLENIGPAIKHSDWLIALRPRMPINKQASKQQTNKNKQTRTNKTSVGGSLVTNLLLASAPNNRACEN